jgi:hypothetical protein
MIRSSIRVDAARVPLHRSVHLGTDSDIPRYRSALFRCSGCLNRVAAVKELQNAGVVFERYAALVQDDDSIGTAPSGAKVAWFKDPDGNVLSISQHQRSVD